MAETRGDPGAGESLQTRKGGLELGRAGQVPLRSPFFLFLLCSRFDSDLHYLCLQLLLTQHGFNYMSSCVCGAFQEIETRMNTIVCKTGVDVGRLSLHRKKVSGTQCKTNDVFVFLLF